MAHRLRLLRSGERAQLHMEIFVTRPRVNRGMEALSPKLGDEPLRVFAIANRAHLDHVPAILRLCVRSAGRGVGTRHQVSVSGRRGNCGAANAIPGRRGA